MTSNKPYSLSDWLTMKPGALIGGFVLTDDGGASLGTGWSKGIVFVDIGGLLKETKFKLREYHKDRRQYIGTGCIYKFNKAAECLPYESNIFRAGAEPLQYHHEETIGVYLGHVLRFMDTFGMCVNVLYKDIEIWVPCHIWRHAIALS